MHNNELYMINSMDMFVSQYCYAKKQKSKIKISTHD